MSRILVMFNQMCAVQIGSIKVARADIARDENAIREDKRVTRLVERVKPTIALIKPVHSVMFPSLGPHVRIYQPCTGQRAPNPQTVELQSQHQRRR